LFTSPAATFLKIVQIYPVSLDSLAIVRVFNRVIGITRSSIRFRYPCTVAFCRVFMDNLNKLVPPAVRTILLR
jgi:uncharacterized membrane protein YfbV (UPF0208 family)